MSELGCVPSVPPRASHTRVCGLHTLSLAMTSSDVSALCFADFASLAAVPTTAGNCGDDMQVDVFSFGVVIYELLIRQVTSAVVSQSGDVNMPQLYANKVCAFASCFFWLLYPDKKLTHQS